MKSNRNGKNVMSRRLITWRMVVVFDSVWLTLYIPWPKFFAHSFSPLYQQTSQFSVPKRALVFGTPWIQLSPNFSAVLRFNNRYKQLLSKFIQKQLIFLSIGFLSVCTAVNIGMCVWVWLSTLVNDNNNNKNERKMIEKKVNDTIERKQKKNHTLFVGCWWTDIVTISNARYCIHLDLMMEMSRSITVFM